MKKLLVLAAVAFMFAACGNSNNQNAAEEQYATETVAASTDSTKSCCGDSTCTKCAADSTATCASCDSTKKAE